MVKGRGNCEGPAHCGVSELLLLVCMPPELLAEGLSPYSGALMKLWAFRMGWVMSLVNGEEDGSSRDFGIWVPRICEWHVHLSY